MKLNKTLVITMIGLGSTAVLLGACGKTEEQSGDVVGGSVSETVMTDDSGDDIVVGSESLKDDGYFKDIVTDGIDPRVKDKISYATDYSNSDWDGITLDITHAKLVTVDHYKDKDGKDFKTLLSLKYKIENEDSSDKRITPDKAEIILSDGTKVKAQTFFDTWDDEILTSNKHKDGYIHFRMEDEEKLENIKGVDVTFKAKDDSGEEVSHTYKIDFPLDAEE